MNHMGGKPKLKLSEQSRNEHGGGVRFMNKGNVNQKIMGRNSCMPVTNVPQRNDMMKNSHLKPRVTSNASGINNNKNEGFHTIQKTNFQKFQPGQMNPPEGERNQGGRMFPTAHNARNSLYDFSKQPMQYNSKNNNNLNEESLNKPKIARKTIHENINLKKNEPNNNNNNIQTNNMGNKNNKMYINTNKEINENMGMGGTLNKTYNQPPREMENSENYSMNNSENFINMLCSPMKRKFNNYENKSKTNQDEIKLSSNKKLVTRNLFNTENSGNQTTEGIKNRNVNGNNENYNTDNISNTKMNKPMNFYNGSDLMNESLMNSYDPSTSDNRYNNNSINHMNNTLNMNNSNNNKFNSKNNVANQKNENDNLNRSFPMGNKNNELFNPGALNKNYTNYERMKNNNNNNNMYILNNNNEMNNRQSNYMENNINPEPNKMRKILENREYSIHKNGMIEGVNTLHRFTMKPNKNDSCIKDTLSEKMEDSCHLHPITATFDHLSDDNFKINKSRKMDRSGDDYSMLNPFYNKNQNESNSLLDISNTNHSSNVHKFGGMINNSDMPKLNASSNKPTSSDKGSLLHHMMDSNQTGNKEKIEMNINSSMENKQDLLGRTHKYSGMENINCNEIEKGKSHKMNKVVVGSTVHLKSCELNDKDNLYFQDVIRNLGSYTIENDTEGLYNNIVSLNNYALNFHYENDCIEEILNITNNITQCTQEIKRVMMNKKKIVQDKRNAINEEYEAVLQRLKECESVFCDTDGDTGERKFAVFHEIDEKKNMLKKQYEQKKKEVEKIQYKSIKLKEQIDIVKRDTEALSKSYKKKYQLMQSVLRVKIIQNTGDALTVCLIPKNTDKEIWHRIKIDKKEVTPQICDYLWKQIESFADEDYIGKH